VDGVSTISPPRLSSDGDTALITLTYRVPVTYFHGSEGIDALRAAVEPTAREGLRVELGGQVPENFSAPSGIAEMAGVGVALIILWFVLGSFRAARLSIAVTLVGVGTGFAGILIMAGFTNVSTTAPTIAMMVGLGVGIDYALLMVARFRDELPGSSSVRDAAAAATGSAGVSVVFAGTTVLVSLLAIRLAGIPLFSTFGYTTAVVVAAVMLASLTLVPALCGLVGVALTSRRGTLQRSDSGQSGLGRWAERITSRPVIWALAGLVVLLVLAVPVLDMCTWPRDAGSQTTSSTIRRAYDLTTSEFGQGANGPFTVGADMTKVSAPELQAGITDLRGDPGIAAVSEPLYSTDGTAALYSIEPTTAPRDAATAETSHRVRTRLGEGMHVTGLTPYFADVSDRLAQRLWLVIIVVVGLAIALLTAAFKAPVMAIKAAVMNLIAVSAAYGVLVVIFQWGWGATVLGLPGAVPISSWAPILIFTILFGLSMDYEVFILSRVREHWLETPQTRQSVVLGLESTARIITGAAAIMIAVFLGFAFDPDITVKMMGVGMAVAVLIDATLIRLITVPATMAVLGRLNWWSPKWLDSVLPDLAKSRPSKQDRTELA
jgi:RND superfamily putative drug exporter